MTAYFVLPGRGDAPRGLASRVSAVDSGSSSKGPLDHESCLDVDDPSVTGL